MTAFSLVSYTVTVPPFSLFHIAVLSCLPHGHLLLQPCRASVTPPPKYFISHPFLPHIPPPLDLPPFATPPCLSFPIASRSGTTQHFQIQGLQPHLAPSAGSRNGRKGSVQPSHQSRDSGLRHAGALVATVLWKGVVLVFVCTPHFSLLDAPP